MSPNYKYLKFTCESRSMTTKSALVPVRVIFVLIYKILSTSFFHTKIINKSKSTAFLEAFAHPRVPCPFCQDNCPRPFLLELWAVLALLWNSLLFQHADFPIIVVSVLLVSTIKALITVNKQINRFTNLFVFQTVKNFFGFISHFNLNYLF